MDSLKNKPKMIRQRLCIKHTQIKDRQPKLFVRFLCYFVEKFIMGSAIQQAFIVPRSLPSSRAPPPPTPKCAPASLIEKGAYYIMFFHTTRLSLQLVLVWSYFFLTLSGLDYIFSTWQFCEILTYFHNPEKLKRHMTRQEKEFS